MPDSPAAPLDADRLRRELEALPAVVRAVVDGPPWLVYLICDAGAATRPVEPAARAVLSSAGLEPADATLHTAELAPAAPRRRVRLVQATLSHPAPAVAAASVTLEWAGRTWTDASEGVSGPGGELRVCGLATIGALRQAVPALPEIQLVGTRSIHVFDRDLLVVLLRPRTGAAAGLLGSTLVSDGLPNSVARAVLNALNRMLGNYVAVGD